MESYPQYEQNPQSSRQNSRPRQQIEESFLSCGSKSFRLKFARCCLRSYTWRCYDFQCQEVATDFFAFSSSSCTASIGRAGARKRRRLIMLLSVGWLPPDVRPSGASLALGSRVACSLCTPSRVPPNRGCVSADAQAKPQDNDCEHSMVVRYGVSGTAWAMAHIQARSSRALATTTGWAFVPLARNCR
jgi:hypothetical protein